MSDPSQHSRDLAHASDAPVACAPPHIRPDRDEAIALPDATLDETLDSGISFRPLLGRHNTARNLSTGLILCRRGAQWRYHSHPFDEAMTLLQGKATVEVEGRRYLLNPLDNIVVPSGRAHYVVVSRNAGEDALFHVAMATHDPRHAPALSPFSRRAMPNGSAGPAGAERVNWHATTMWYEPAAGARFQDFFNRDLGTDRISGGYGRFAPGARLPCHLHDFDESITIVEGSATCVVEGRRYALSGCMTALCPRGRCHYFVNESDRTMAMLWVYAGPMPERIVLDERCCTTECGCAN